MFQNNVNTIQQYYRIESEVQYCPVADPENLKEARVTTQFVIFLLQKGGEVECPKWKKLSPLKKKIQLKGGCVCVATPPPHESATVAPSNI